MIEEVVKMIFLDQRIDKWIDKYLGPIFIVVFGIIFGSYGMQSRGEKSIVALIALIIGLLLLIVGFVCGIILHFKKRTRSA